jgi:hypothetical protein
VKLMLRLRVPAATLQLKDHLMDIAPLLVEQRRVGHEYRSTETMLQTFEAQLSARGLDAGARAKIEEAAENARAALQRLWDRMLELDAAVTASAFKSGEP